MPKGTAKASSSSSTGTADKEHWVEPEPTEGPEYSPDALPEGYAAPDDAAAGVYAMVTRQLALQAIWKEFDSVGSMGTWDFDSVDEEANVKDQAMRSGETIHIADLLAICSEKHVELSPALRALKGRVFYRGDSAKTADGKLALYQTEASCRQSIPPVRIEAWLLQNTQDSQERAPAYILGLVEWIPTFSELDPGRMSLRLCCREHICNRSLASCAHRQRRTRHQPRQADDP